MAGPPQRRISTVDCAGQGLARSEEFVGDAEIEACVPDPPENVVISGCMVGTEFEFEMLIHCLFTAFLVTPLLYVALFAIANPPLEMAIAASKMLEEGGLERPNFGDDPTTANMPARRHRQRPERAIVSMDQPAQAANAMQARHHTVLVPTL
jgi:hypothetical protein